MHVSRWQQPLLIWLGWGLVALFLQLGPSVFQQTLTRRVLDGAGKSLIVVDQIHHWLTQPRSVTPSVVDEQAPDDGRLIALQRQNQDLAAMLVLLKEENLQLKSIPEVDFSATTTPLQRTSGVSARVIGRQGETASTATQFLISLGKKQGLVGGELALGGAGILIDQGDAAQLSPDELVTCGRSLFGRTVTVGKWTTSVQPITDLNFRTAVRLVRTSSFGTVTSARGILKGTGDGCEIVEVVGTEAVAVGDLVYTDVLVSPTAVPIYCGTVTEAMIEPNAPHWSIRVTPHFSESQIPAELTVLKTELTTPPAAENLD